MTVSVLFVCLGNICRSPLAEAALRQKCLDSGESMIIDSAGTGDWHVGQAPDQRAQAVAVKNGVDISHLRARLVVADDFRSFDHIIALDNLNRKDLLNLKPSDATAEVSLLFDHLDGRAGEDVADPYYGAEGAFDQTWEEVTAAAEMIHAKLSRKTVD